MELHTVPTRPVDSYPARLVAAAAERAFDVVFTSQTTYLLQVRLHLEPDSAPVGTRSAHSRCTSCKAFGVQYLQPASRTVSRSVTGFRPIVEASTV